MSLRLVGAAVLLVLAVVPAAAKSEGFLVGPRRGTGHATVEDFQAAMGAVMGCGGTVASDRLVAVEKLLTPMWRVLPKNEHGLVEWRMVRYLAHRYFMQQSSLLVRGFEPMRQVNASHLGTPDILGQGVMQTALDESRSPRGFSLKDAVAMVTTLEQLVSDAESTLLETVYKQLRRAPQQRLGHDQLYEVAEAYMIHWMLGDQDDAIPILMKNKTLLAEVLPKWHDIKQFMAGEVKAMEFRRQRAPQPGHAEAALTGRFSFEEAHETVGGFTKRFASFWESECQVIKKSLVELDKTGTGRVPLKDFYGANADGEWRFGESEAYLRELGALDESSPWKGKQVIIPNYMQGASNCIVTTPHYLVCCVSECEAVLNEIEDHVGAPVAQPSVILSLVSNMTGLDDVAPELGATLKTQLLRIAETHGGSVPIHGRLFAQWLHYVFPRECPFPHKAGATSAATPAQFGESFMASDVDIQGHAATRNESSAQGALEDVEEAQLMSQWSEEEELIADYALHLKAPWAGSSWGMMLVVIVVSVGLFAAGASLRTTEKAGHSPGMFDHKAHYV
jgi:hypothetical protein